MAKKKVKTPDNTIAVNRKARHEYSIEETYEAGMVLQGWEVKSLRAGKLQLAESYVLIKRGEVFLIGSHITPLNTASTHVKADPTRTRKLLLHDYEISKLIGAVERDGYTIVPLSMYWIKGRAKLKIAFAKGKKDHDKRSTEKNRDWQRQKARLMKSG
ncbi:SsrA-binding protein SmpB [Piscirickettsia salmonis]|uniref:SsrA-binding protein SmpB n=1 Tax=Piscirickettsia salmonis TaxID=1238 RepID=UPI0007C96177|nr:SsrA-binding protein [Piscirickettsiaceae bacterium NZ-RLO1]